MVPSMVTRLVVSAHLFLQAPPTLPPGNDPGPFKELDDKFNPAGEGLMWYVKYRVVPIALVVALVLLIVAVLRGNRQGVSEGRGRIGGVVTAVVLLIVGMWAVAWVWSRA